MIRDSEREKKKEKRTSQKCREQGPLGPGLWGFDKGTRRTKQTRALPRDALVRGALVVSEAATAAGDNLAISKRREVKTRMQSQ